MLMNKPAASLSASLLARKGEAQPAIPRQSIGAQPPRDVRNLAGERGRVGPVAPAMSPLPPAYPDMRGVAKHAFTLRLDDHRHFKLRLAVAACGRSAQQIVIEALDAYLVTLPEVEALAAQLPASTHTIVRGPES
jgi:hypothetical protein